MTRRPVPVYQVVARTILHAQHIRTTIVIASRQRGAATDKTTVLTVPTRRDVRPVALISSDVRETASASTRHGFVMEWPTARTGTTRPCAVKVRTSSSAQGHGYVFLDLFHFKFYKMDA